MKAFVKFLLKLLTKFMQTIIWLKDVLLFTDRKNHVLYSEKPRPLSIIANGPSLANDIESISNFDTDFSVVNYFYKSPVFIKIKPTIYVIFDPYFFEVEDSIKPIFDMVFWRMKLVVPFSAWKKYSFLKEIPNQNIEIVPIHGILYRGFEKYRNWAYRHGLAMPKGQNVVVPSIFNAINMGYKEVRLYGVDHSWTKALCVTDDNLVCAIDSHFYDTQEVKLEPYMNSLGGYYMIHELLRDFSFMFEAYHDIRQYADIMGCRVINMTKGSFIDAFERGGSIN